MKPIAICCVSLLLFKYSISQILINECASTNLQLVQDENNDYPDWIELYNAGSTSVNVNGWGLTDNNKWNKWQLPNVMMLPGSRIMVYASGNNLNGYNSTPGPSTHHWETALFDNNFWQYMVGTTAPPSNWKVDYTNASNWASGQGGFGYGDGDDNTTVPAGTVTVYYRKTFEITDLSVISEMLLSMDYDDGFVAYINGVEIARNGLSGTPTYDMYSQIDHEAQMYSGGLPEQFYINYGLLQSLLVQGTNMLAVEIHNSANWSSDLTGRTWLHTGIANANTYFSPNPSWFTPPVSGGGNNMHTNFKISYNEVIKLYNNTGVLQDSVMMDVLAGDARCRLPDGGAWCYTDAPTPNAPNTGVCYSGYTPAPTVTPDAGFYNSTQSVTMTGSGVRYTLNGDTPTSTSTLYTGPVNIASTSVLKARAFQSGKLPSAVVTRSYFINDPTTLPVVSIITHSGNLFDDGTGGPAVYDNASGFTDAGTTGCTIQYFDATHAHQFTTDCSLTPVGNWSLGFAQKSMQFKYKEEYGALGDVTYNIFSYDKPGLGPSGGFRVRNTDDDWGPPYGTGARMRDLIANRMAIGTYAGTAAYQNVAVFINGQYWGHYAAREMLNDFFMRDNYGATRENVHMVKNAYPVYDYQAEEGTTDTFIAMSDFIINNDMSVEANYQQALQMIDIKNWVDYWADEVYNNNADWFPSYWFNNTRLAHSPADDIKWKYILWDVGFSQGNEGTAFDNLLEQALLYPNTPNRHTDMMLSLLQNPGFKNYFINRFADLLNWHWTIPKVHAIINQCAAEIAPEINRQNARWGSGSQTYWQGQVNNLKNYHTQRPSQQRLHIQNYFGLSNQVQITLAVNPPNAGVIKISTITPTSYPWTGLYYNGNPVQVTAIANPGFTFTNWSANAFIANATSPTFTNNITTNTTFTANFTGSAVTPNILITEVNYHSDPSRDAGDWIELYNNSSAGIDLSDWSIEDQNFYNHWLIPTGTVIGPGQFLVVCQDLAKFQLQFPAVTNVIGSFEFGLNNGGDAVKLKNRTGTVVWSFAYNDNSPWPCTPDGHGRTLELTTLAADPALPGSWFDGCMGGSPGSAYGLCSENPVVSEINYKSHPLADAGDWIELYNKSNVPFDVSNWKVGDQEGNLFTLPAGTVMAPQSRVVIAQNTNLFNTQFPMVTNAVGPTVFGFNGDGDVIRIHDASGKLVLSVCYNDVAPWPLQADGEGYTLELQNPNSNLNDAGNWFAGCPGGSPSVAYNPQCLICIVQGCTNPEACNYLSTANCDDGSCTLPGCTNPSACNYNAAAGCDNGSCQLPGCTNPAACNYNSAAGCDNGSCLLPGCTNPEACNYDSGAGCDNGSCSFATNTYYLDADSDGFGNALSTTIACTLPAGYATISGDCNDGNPLVYPGAPGTHQNLDNNCNGQLDPDELFSCPGDLNADGLVNTGDLLILMAAFGCNSDCAFDFTGDGAVNTSDLLVFMSVFGTLCN